MNIYDKIKENFDSGDWRGFSKKKIFSMLGIKSESEKKSFEKILNELTVNGAIVCLDGRYESVKNSGCFVGKLRGNERGFAFFVADEEKIADMFIPHKSLNGALHGDRVLVRKALNGRSDDEGEVVAILKRGITEICGTYYKTRNFGFVRPDDKNYFTDIYVPLKFTGGARSCDKVAVQIYSFPQDNNPEGRVKEIFGKRFDLKSEEKSIIKSYNFQEEFPYAVKKEVEKIPSFVTDDLCVGRADFTDRFIITIDGEDSRDFDDAVEVWKEENGNYMLGVHIADVSEYVKRGSMLDKEALTRATSVYFPDKVIPMLPKELSNGICSLNEGEKRLTVSCIAEITSDGEVVDKKIIKSVISSKKRMTYTEVQEIIENGKNTSANEELKNAIFLMKELQEVLSLKRSKRGSVDLDVNESHVYLKGKEIFVEEKQSKQAYKIIEEFMVVANECVAEYAFYLDIPFIYRIHEKPSPEKAKAFADFAATLGAKIKWKPDEVRSLDFATVLEKFRGEDVFPIVNRIMLRSMQKARYYPENRGHFGLAGSCYCHFTSPIRRYPDLVVHRVLKAVIDGQIGELNDLYKDFVCRAAQISSDNERRADEAERSVDDLYKAYYMRSHIGEEFDAVISGVNQNGIYCELKNTVEGFTSVSDLPRGNYVYDEKRFALVSGKRKFALGDKVKVGVVGVDEEEKKVEFIILEKYQ